MLKLATIADLNTLLRWNRLYANGKNICVDHLYATAAESRFAVENLLGIYLADPDHAWMAVWMAVTDRAVIKKRQLQYYAPDVKNSDSVGHLGIHVIDDRPLPDDAFVHEAYVHLFRLDHLGEVDVLRIDDRLEERDKLDALEAVGFTVRDIELRGRVRRALVSDLADAPLLVQVDAWQVALVNVPRLVPTVTVQLLPSLVRELRGRVQRIPHPPGADYLQPPLDVLP